jgi:hypothetical protein
MEYTRDVIDDKFGVSGGSAILTDGAFYWRRDAAEYVDHYGIALLDAFLVHGRGLLWIPPVLTRERVLEIDQDLFRRFSGSADAG